MKTISSDREFREIYNSGRRYEGKLFRILIEKSQTKAAFGIVVNKKVGNAVIRNRIKRRIRSYLREALRRHSLKYRILIIAKPEAGKSDWQMLKKDLDDLFTHICN